MKPQILMVDDDPNVFELLQMRLAEDGYDLLWAPDAATFKNIVSEQKPHLIILDIVLGKDDGPEVYNELLRQGFLRDVPVIFLSGLVTTTPLPELNPGRTCAIHPKPFHYQALLRDIRHLTAAA